ncbi:MAG: hypothetical protein ACI9O6_001148 [Glaciecola sp.]|jgi:hypothetical protein
MTTMSIDLTIFAINSLVRLGKSGMDAYDAAARNEDILFPNLKQIRLDFPASIDHYFNLAHNRHYVRGDDAPYSQHWFFDGQYSRPKEDAQSLDALMILATQIEAKKGKTFMASRTGPAAILVKTWKEGNQPLSPMARIALVGADVALEYVGNNTGSVGGGNGAKLISAYAKSLADQLPNDGNLSSKDKVRETLSGILLRAGFDTIAKHPNWVTNEDHLVALIKSTVDPLTEAFPLDTDSQVVEFEALQNVLMGPAADALLNTLAEHQSAFLGTDFAPDKALGAITKALFVNAKEIGLDNQFSKQGLVSLYKASLEVVATQPSLFFDNDGSAKEQLISDAFSSMAGVLSKAEYPFDRQTGVDLAKVSMAAMSKNLAKFADNNKPWEQTSAAILSNMMDTMLPIIGKKGALKNVFSEAQLFEYGRIMLIQMSKSPSMLVHKDKEVYSGLVVAMASAMSADKKLLLSSDDWLKIVAVAAQEAATNPMRLFDLDPDNPKEVLAGELMKVMLDAAAEFATTQGNKSVLFGQVLADTMEILLSACSGNVSAARAKIGKIKKVMKKINVFMSTRHEKFGSKEFLVIFRRLLENTLDNLDVPQLTDDFVIGLLKGQN